MSCGCGCNGAPGGCGGSVLTRLIGFAANCPWYVWPVAVVIVNALGGKNTSAPAKRGERK